MTMIRLHRPELTRQIHEQEDAYQKWDSFLSAGNFWGLTKLTIYGNTYKCPKGWWPICHQCDTRHNPKRRRCLCTLCEAIHEPSWRVGDKKFASMSELYHV